MKNSTTLFHKSVFSVCRKIDFAICLHGAGKDHDDIWIHPDRSSGHYLAGCDNSRAEKLRGHLWAKNQSENGSIYFRPVGGSPLILLDEGDSLKIARRYSSLVINTSPGKYQAWIMTDLGLSFDERHLIQLSIIRKLNHGPQNRADAGASNGNQIGRVPGFHNRKPIYAANPPAVRIIGEPFSAGRKLNAAEHLNNKPYPRPNGGGAVPSMPATRDKNKSNSGEGESEREFGFAINSLRRGKPPHFIMHNLIERNQRMGRRQGNDAERYARLTIYNAARELGIEISI